MTSWTRDDGAKGRNGDSKGRGGDSKGRNGDSGADGDVGDGRDDEGRGDGGRGDVGDDGDRGRGDGDEGREVQRRAASFHALNLLPRRRYASVALTDFSRETTLPVREFFFSILRVRDPLRGLRNRPLRVRTLRLDARTSLRQYCDTGP